MHFHRRDEAEDNDPLPNSRVIGQEMAKRLVKSPHQDVSHAVLQYALQFPESGQFTVSIELAKRGLAISPSGVRSIWKRHALETVYLRLLAKAKLSTTGGKELTPSQTALLKRERVSNRLKVRAEVSSESMTDLRRVELLQAAAKIFSKKGFEAASLREICSVAGIQATSLYYHFRSKENLFATVHRLGMRNMNAALDEAAADSSDPWKQLEDTCATAMRFVLEDTDLAAITRVAMHVHYKTRLQRQLKADRAAYEDRFQTIIDKLPLPPEFDRTLFKLALFGAMNWANTWYRPGRLSPEEIGRNLVRDIFKVQRFRSGPQEAIDHSGTAEGSSVSLTVTPT